MLPSLLRSLHSTQHSLADGASNLKDPQLPISASAAEQNANSHTHTQHSMDFEALEEPRHSYLHVVLAGGIGGLTGDMLMHSLDTVKTRQQGDPHRPSKYNSLFSTYRTILRQEGIPRGLYGGVSPAALGSFIGTSLFFGSYEWSKRLMLDCGLAPSLAYLNAGLVADLVVSPLYVPSEVLKTRLQLQGRYNNPHFDSGYNYRSLWHATRTIVKTEGLPALYYGFRATLCRDLPFSALQFTFYEKEREFAKFWVGSKNIGLPLEIATGAVAGGLAGAATCPLDVVKTRLQTQVTRLHVAPRFQTTSAYSPSAAASRLASTSGEALATKGAPRISSQQTRHISTSSASTSIPKPGSVILDTSSVLKGLRLIYKVEGLGGWFRGVGPRVVWTAVQSGAMFSLYQILLSWFGDRI